jgi:hypothetical protein
MMRMIRWMIDKKRGEGEELLEWLEFGRKTY